MECRWDVVLRTVHTKDNLFQVVKFTLCLPSPYHKSLSFVKSQDQKDGIGCISLSQYTEQLNISLAFPQLVSLCLLMVSRKWTGKVTQGLIMGFKKALHNLKLFLHDFITMLGTLWGYSWHKLIKLLSKIKLIVSYSSFHQKHLKHSTVLEV